MDRQPIGKRLPDSHDCPNHGSAAGIEAAGSPRLSSAVKKWLIGIALFATVVVTYIPAARCGYAWDDDALLTENPPVLTGRFLDLWVPGTTLQFYPTVFSTYWAEHKLWGLNPLGYHIDNILLHAGSVVLLWLVLCRLGVRGALVAALLFGLHPVQVESVAWITARKNVLSGIFYLASILAYLQFAFAEPGRDDRAIRSRMYLLSFLLFLVAVLSKSVTCSMPAVILLIIWWKRGRIALREVTPLLPMFALGAGLGSLTAWMEKNLVGANGIDWHLSFLDRCLLAARALWFYPGKLLWPADLTFIYPRWQIDATVWWQWLFPLGGLALLTILLVLRRRIGRGPLVAVLFFAGTLLPALGFIDVYPMRYSFVADHFQYLASIGIIVLVVSTAAAALSRLGARPAVARAASVATVLACAIMTSRQCLAYENLETLWTDTVRKNPGCWMAHYNLGNLLAVRGDVDEAIIHFRKSVEAKPDQAEARNNLASVLTARGRFDEAMAEYRQALRIQPDHAEAHYNLGTVLVGLGQTDEAIFHLQKALAAKPNYAKAHRKLATVLAGRGQADEAVVHFRKALGFAVQQNMPALADSIRDEIRHCEAARPAP